MTTTTVFLLKLVTSEKTMFVYRPKTFLKKTKQKIKQTKKNRNSRKWYYLNFYENQYVILMPCSENSPNHNAVRVLPEVKFKK